MLDIEKAKKQAGLLADYLRTVGKKLKHTHALEAVARMNGHKSWNTFQSDALAASGLPPAELTGEDLANLFASGDVSHVTLDGARYDIRYYSPALVLGVYLDILAGTHPDYSDNHTCVELERVEEGQVWEEGITIKDISQTKYADGAWTLPDGGVLRLYKSELAS
jgi:hypothetical protein